MSKIALICDSTADFPEADRERLNVDVVPLNVHFGTEVLRDQLDISPSQFLARLETSAEMPRTSQPSPAAFSAAYESAARDHDAILVLTLSSKLSGTYQSAVLGTQSTDLEIPIRIVDSTSASIGLGLQVYQARALIDGGNDLDEIESILQRERDRYHLIFFADTLEFLQRGGRIGKASQLLGSLFKIKPLLLCQNGEVLPYEKTRSRSRAVEGIIEFARKFPMIERMAILHDGSAPSDVDNIVSSMEDRVAADHIMISRYGPIIATHVGPGALGVCVFAGTDA